MKVELTRFRVVEGKSERVDEWLRMLNERMSETVATLQRERMYVEVIFREKVDDEEYLSWLAIQGEGGKSVHSSSHEVDRLHLEFWRECIDTNYGAYEAQPQVVMVPDAVAAAMKWSNPEASVVRWDGGETRRDMKRTPPPEQQDADEGTV